MKGLCDLHTHSNCSDGTMTPRELVALAKELGLEGVALTDHNTVAGLEEFRSAGQELGIRTVPGVEFSTEYREKELHLLCLFPQEDHYGTIREKLAEALKRKERSNLDLVEALDSAGVHLDYAAIKAGTPNGQVNRALIAAEMVRRDYCATVRDAFDQWLAPELGYFRPPQRLGTLEMVEFIRELGGVSVLAHPWLNLNEGELTGFLREAVPLGLDGLEGIYSEFTPDQREKLIRIAGEHGLLVSGGSDFHGGNKPDIALGSGKGDLRVPVELLDLLEERSVRNRT